MEALAIPVLLRRCGCNVLDLRASLGDPPALCLRDHQRAFVATDVLRDDLQAQRVSQRLNRDEAAGAPCHLQRQARPAMLVDQRQSAQAPPFVGLCLHEVEALDVVAVERTHPHARAVVELEPAMQAVLRRDLGSFAKPDQLNPILAHLPARYLQQHGDAAVAIALILGRRGDDGAGQRILVSRYLGHVALRTPCWPKVRQACRSQRPYFSSMPSSACRRQARLRWGIGVPRAAEAAWWCFGPSPDSFYEPAAPRRR